MVMRELPHRRRQGRATVRLESVPPKVNAWVLPDSGDTQYRPDLGRIAALPSVW